MSVNAECYGSGSTGPRVLPKGSLGRRWIVYLASLFMCCLYGRLAPFGAILSCSTDADVPSEVPVQRKTRVSEALQFQAAWLSQ